MIFRIDYKIDSEKKNDEKYIKDIYKEFCQKYIDQIRNKLNFKSEFLSILDTSNKQTNINDNLTEKEIQLEEIQNQTIDIIRFEMEMINPVISKDMRIKNKKPKISRPIITKEESIERKSKRKVI